MLTPRWDSPSHGPENHGLEVEKPAHVVNILINLSAGFLPTLHHLCSQISQIKDTHTTLGFNVPYVP